ncbi:MAG: hypothetical protein RLZZ262_2042 [Bacteroidota bacterium]|jgi:hypothetical protein
MLIELLSAWNFEKSNDVDRWRTNGGQLRWFFLGVQLLAFAA